MRFSRFVRLCAAFGAVAVLSMPSAVRAEYSQNFDALALGPINGQDGWAGGATDVVQTNLAKSARGLEVHSSITCVRDGAFASYAAAPVQRVRMDYMILNTGGTTTSNVEFIGPADAPTANRYVRLNYLGAPNAFLIEGAGATLFGPGTVQPNVWYDVQVDMDFTAKTADFLIRNPDGTTFFDPGPMNMAQPVASNRLAFNAALGPTLYIDNVAVSNVPEPAAAGALALACAAFLTARRRPVAAGSVHGRGWRG